MNINEHISGEITVYAYLVKNGKPAALVSIQTRYIDASIKIIESHGLHHHHSQLADGWFELWMYKDPNMKEIIESLPNVPTTAFDHWVLGKMFGYSDIEIFTFITKHSQKISKEADEKIKNEFFNGELNEI